MTGPGGIVFYFWQLCLLRSSPAQLPSSNFATGLVFSVYLAIAVVIYLLIRPGQPLPAMLGTIAIGVILQAGATFLLLQFMDYLDRFRATWTALLGANAIMLLVLLPFNLILLYSDIEWLLSFANSATWVCLGWWLAVAGYIYHRSAGVSILQGSALAFLIELIGVIFAYTLFPR